MEKNKIRYGLFLLLIIFLSSCESTSNRLDSVHDCGTCELFFAQNSEIEYNYLNYCIGFNQGLTIGSCDVASVKSRENWLGKLRVFEKNKFDDLFNHIYCFLGKDLEEVKSFFSPKSEWFSKDNGLFKNVSVSYDIGECITDPNTIDWQYLGTLN